MAGHSLPAEYYLKKQLKNLRKWWIIEPYSGGGRGYILSGQETLWIPIHKINLPVTNSGCYRLGPSGVYAPVLIFTKAIVGFCYKLLEQATWKHFSSIMRKIKNKMPVFKTLSLRYISNKMIKYNILYTFPLTFYTLTTTTDYKISITIYSKIFKGMSKHNQQKHIIFVVLNKFDFWGSYELQYI